MAHTTSVGFVGVSAMNLPGPNGAYFFEPAEVDRLRELRGARKQMPRDVETIGASL